MTETKTSEENNKIRNLLPFWARKLLAMNDAATEKNHKIRVPSEKEGA